MFYLFSIVRQTVGLLIDILSTLMFIRAIMSWFPNMSNTRFAQFLYTVTEWVVAPFRAMFDAFGWGRGTPIDLPYFVAFIVISIISNFV